MGDSHVVKLRASIYSTLGRAFEAIALHNYLFPKTIMRVVDFTRDDDGLFRIILHNRISSALGLPQRKKLTLWFYQKDFITMVIRLG